MTYVHLYILHVNEIPAVQGLMFIVACCCFILDVAWFEVSLLKIINLKSTYLFM